MKELIVENEQLFSSSTLDDLVPLHVIRTESELSKYPVHNLAKKGRVNIEIKRLKPDGQIDVKWEVSFSERYGQARQLAYKLDTIVINRCIDGLTRPLPELIRIGSLRDIAEDLGLGNDTPTVRKIFLQNASAFINAKLKYKANDQSEQTLEAGFTRYTVLFTGDRLPNGSKADCVYIELHPRYREVLNNAPTRPLNYEYLKALNPAAQRFYEIVSRNIFAAFNKGGGIALLRYSDYCTYSAQQRYFTYTQFKKQMHKVHLPHKKSGYITKIEYEEKLDGDGKTDWLMKYTPGPKARAEFEAFRRNPKSLLARPARLRHGSKAEERDASAETTLDTSSEIPIQVKVNDYAKTPREPVPNSLQHLVKTSPEPPQPPIDPQLLSALTSRGIMEGEARKLLLRLPANQPVIDQLEYGDAEIASRPNAFKNPPGFYIRLLEDNSPLPATFESSRQKAARLEAIRAQQQQLLDQQDLEAQLEQERRDRAKHRLQALTAEQYMALRHRVELVLMQTPMIASRKGTALFDQMVMSGMLRELEKPMDLLVVDTIAGDIA